MRIFLGAIGFLRPNLDLRTIDISKLTRLTSSKTKFEWTAASQKAFNEIKRALKNAIATAIPDESADFMLECDWSKSAKAAVLYQRQKEDEDWSLVEIWIKVNSAAEQRLSSWEGEARTVLEATKHFYWLLRLRRFTIVTDAQALLSCANSARVSNVIQRGLLKISGMRFNLIHRAGSLNKVPDMFSRLVITPEGQMIAAKTIKAIWEQS